MEEIKLLKKMRLLKGLTKEELIKVGKVIKKSSFKKGSTVLGEGSAGGSIYLVKSGILKVSHVVRGRQRELGTFRSGDHFGEVSFIDKKTRSATIYAAKDAELIVITRRAFENLLGDSPHLQLKLMEGLLEDLCNKLRLRKFSLDFEFSDLLPLAIFEIDVKGNITFANRNGLESFGYEESDFDNGLNLFQMFISQDRTRAKKDLGIRAHGSPEREYTALRKDGGTFPVLLHADPMIHGRKTTGFRTTLVNITEQKHAEQALERKVQERTAELQQTNLKLREQIAERDRAEKARIQAESENRRLEESLRKAHMMETMGRLVTGVAHEVRNPLNVIQITAEALQLDLTDSPECNASLEVIRTQVGRLSQLMRELLELGRPAEESRMQEESLSQLCASAIHLWKQSTQAAAHQIRFELPEQDNLHIIVDGARIQQIILNLLDNAAQHSPPGSEICVNAFEKTGDVHLCVTDKGAGVSPENVPRLFEPFFTTRRSGIGLGLSLVKHIVETQGGHVVLYNNDPLPGCTVEITFKSAPDAIG